MKIALNPNTIQKADFETQLDACAQVGATGHQLNFLSGVWRRLNRESLHLCWRHSLPSKDAVLRNKRDRLGQKRYPVPCCLM